MPIGPTIRSALGPLERPVGNVYRATFINLDALIALIKQWVDADSILEIGCGEGAVAERLEFRFPKAEILGIDITPRIGRMYRNSQGKVNFQQQTIGELAATSNRNYDLVLIADVLHHVPWDQHHQLLEDARKVLKPGGALILKDWIPTMTPIHGLCYFLDRYVTGDRVKFKCLTQWTETVERVFGPDSIEKSTTVPPWRNNFCLLVRDKISSA